MSDGGLIVDRVLFGISWVGVAMLWLLTFYSIWREWQHE